MTPRRGLRYVGAVRTAGAIATQASDAAVSASPPPLTEGQLTALAAGFQIAPEGSAATANSAVAQPNPLSADLSAVDISTWRERMKAGARDRLSSAAYRSARASEQARTAAVDAPVVWDEREPSGVVGSNDALSSAERISAFGTAAGKNSVVRPSACTRPATRRRRARSRAPRMSLVGPIPPADERTGGREGSARRVGPSRCPAVVAGSLVVTVGSPSGDGWACSW
ncbi:MAG: hypothetical protein ACRCYX_03165 [Dermatophilaceae bacterium]